MKGTQVTPLYSLSAGSTCALFLRSGDEVADAHGEDDLRLVVQVATECVGTDAGGPEQLRGAQRVRRDDHEPRAATS